MTSTALAQPGLRPAERRMRRKYSFTPAMDEEIRRAYHLFLEYNNRKAIGACARKLQLPKWSGLIQRTTF